MSNSNILYFMNFIIFSNTSKQYQQACWPILYSSSFYLLLFQWYIYPTYLQLKRKRNNSLLVQEKHPLEPKCNVVLNILYILFPVRWSTKGHFGVILLIHPIQNSDLCDSHWHITQRYSCHPWYQGLNIYFFPRHS